MQQLGNSEQQAVTVELRLGDKELQAIQMKYLGKPSKEIAEALGYSESSIRRLFMVGGRLERAYQDYVLRQQANHEDVTKQALEIAKAETIAAVGRIVKLSRSAESEAGILKSNERVLSLGGISEQTAPEELFRNTLKSLGYDRSKKLLDELFYELFGKQFQDIEIIITRADSEE